MEALFAAATLLVLPLWLLMIVLPRWRWTERLLASPAVLLPLPGLYVVLVLPRLGEFLPLLVRPTLAGVAALLATEDGAVIAWLHLLAFDLFVGRWAYLDSRQRRLSPWLASPVLILILMLGPVGLLAYLALKRLGPGDLRPRPE